MDDLDKETLLVSSIMGILLPLLLLAMSWLARQPWLWRLGI